MSQAWSSVCPLTKFWIYCRKHYHFVLSRDPAIDNQTHCNSSICCFKPETRKWDSHFGKPSLICDSCFNIPVCVPTNIIWEYITGIIEDSIIKPVACWSSTEEKCDFIILKTIDQYSEIIIFTANIVSLF